MSTSHRMKVIQTLQNICQCSRETAREILEATEWNEEAALEILLDSNTNNQNPDLFASKPTEAFTTEPFHLTSETTNSTASNDEIFPDSLLPAAFETNVHIKSQEENRDIKPSRPNAFQSIISSTLDTSSSDDEDLRDEDDTFHTNDSTSNVELVSTPSDTKNDNENLADTLEFSHAQFVTDEQNEKASSVIQSAEENLFSSIRNSQNDENAPSNNEDQWPSTRSAVSANCVEQVPIRFYSNGFTVSNGDLRKFEENREFLDYIKRGEIPPELRKSSTGGRQIEVHIEDRRDEEYKRTVPSFKPFGGTGHAVGLSNSTQASVAPQTTSEISDAGEIEKLAEISLNTSTSTTMIRLRLPSVPTPVRIKIDLHRTLNDIRKFLNENIPSLKCDMFDFMEPPSTKIKREDEIRQISDTRLSNSLLIVRQTA